MEEVPRRTSLVPLAFPCFVLRLIGLETKNVLDYQGRAGDHFHCTVERSPGHIRCRMFLRTSSTTTRDRFICNFGAPSPLVALHWIFCFFSSIYVHFSKTSPLKSGESSEESSGENRVKSCHVCGCHGFFGPEFPC